MEATIQGCRIQYDIRRHGDVSAPVVLLLHGWGCDGNIFASTQSAFEQHATVFNLDFPGHGSSDEPPVPWDVHAYANLVKELLEKEEIDRIDIVAHSFGARVAVVLADENPHLVRRMVLTGAAGIKATPSAKQHKRTAKYKRCRQMLDAVGKIGFLQAVVEKWQAGLRDKFGSADYRALKTDLMRSTFVKVITEDLSPLLFTIQAPTLLVWGDSDTETPLWMGKQMERDIPDAGLVLLQGRGHYAFLEECQRFCLIVDHFLWEGQQ